MENKRNIVKIDEKLSDKIKENRILLGRDGEWTNRSGEIRITRWRETKQIEVFVTEFGEKRSRTTSFVLNDDEINTFINTIKLNGEVY